MAFFATWSSPNLWIWACFLASSKTQFLFILFDAAPQPIWLVFPVSLVFISVQFSAVHCAQTSAPFNRLMTIVNIGVRKTGSPIPCVIRPCPRYPSPPDDWSPGRSTIHWLRALSLGWRLGYWVLLRTTSFLPWTSPARRMISWLPTNELLRSGNRPKPQQWKSDESTEVEETSAEDDHDWNDDSDADWTIDSEDHSSLSGESVYALVASWRTGVFQAQHLRDWLVGFWRRGDSNLRVVEGLGRYYWFVRSQLWTNCFWPTCTTMAGTRNSIFSRCWSQVWRSLSGKTSDVCRKVFARARSVFLCATPRDVGDAWPGHHNPKALLSWSRLARMRNSIVLPQRVAPFYRDRIRILHTFLRLLLKDWADLQKIIVRETVWIVSKSAQ